MKRFITCKVTFDLTKAKINDVQCNFHSKLYRIKASIEKSVILKELASFMFH